MSTPPRALSSNQVRALRLRAQHLADPAPRDALVDVVRDLVGVQAQMPAAASLSLRARVAGLTREDLREALEVRRTLVRTWVMRGTIHLVRTEDVRWMLPALPTSVFREVPRWLKRRAGLELGEASAVARKVERLLLSRGPMTRSEIVEAVGVAPETAYGLMRLAGLDGRICFGPERGADQTFVAVTDWLPDLPPLAAPEPGALARRFLAGYGPAEPADLAVWWGLPLGMARTEWRAWGEAVDVSLEGRTLSVLAEHLEGAAVAPAPSVRLVGAWDTYLLGHADRSFILDPQHARKVNRGGGWLHPVVLVDGRVAGTWRAERRARRLQLEVEAFTPITRQARAGIHEEAEDVGRFLDMPVDLKIRRRT
jgi:Winged helix DNA-binding domain